MVARVKTQPEYFKMIMEYTIESVQESILTSRSIGRTLLNHNACQMATQPHNALLACEPFMCVRIMYIYLICWINMRGGIHWSYYINISPHCIE